VEYLEHVDAVEENAGAFARALRAGPLDVTVPTCPKWSLADLARHVGEFSGFWSHVLCEGTGRPKTPFADPPEAAAMADWYEALAGHLVAELRATPPGTSVWTWVPTDQSARFVARRVAHELAVHRVDAQLTRGAAEPVASALAADGIEEIFVMIGAWGAPAGRGSGETLHLHEVDGEHEWLLTLAPSGLEVDRRHGRGDLALRGTVSDLELTLYQRPALGPMERLGDDRVLDAWHRAFTFG
jgi:uncharacterized protein (TIGR03083 family)